jgi:hypothetical protein
MRLWHVLVAGLVVVGVVAGTGWLRAEDAPVQEAQEEQGYTFSIALPRTDNSGTPVAPRVYREFGAALAQRFAGVSILTSSWGCWEESPREIQCEENVVFQAARICGSEDALREIGAKTCPEARVRDRGFVKNLVKEYAVKLGQEEVFVREMSEGVMMVPGKKLEKLEGDLVDPQGGRPF